jgi:hypothetical protein
MAAKTPQNSFLQSGQADQAMKALEQRGEDPNPSYNWETVRARHRLRRAPARRSPPTAPTR